MKKSTNLFIAIIFTVNCSGQNTFEKTFTILSSNFGWRSFACQQTSDGNYIIASYSPAPPMAHDIQLIKLNVNGDTIWTQIFNWTYTICRSMQQTADSGFILTGLTSNFAYGETYLLKTNSNGNVQWVKTYVMTNDNYDCYSVRQTNDGGYILTGNTDWTTDADMFLIKTDSTGNIQWSKTYGSQYDDWGNCVQQTYDGGYIMAGSIVSFSNYDVCIVKTDNSGNVQWTKTFGLTGNERGRWVQQTPDSGYIVTGNSSNAYLIKTDFNGNLIWSKEYIGGMGGVSVDRTNDGGYIIEGRTPGAALIKVDALGNFSWAKSYSGNGYSEGYSAKQTADGGYFFSGETDAGVHIVYAVKTDSLGNSGCSTVASITTTTPATIVTSPAIIVSSVNTIVTIRSVTTSSGVTPVSLCQPKLIELVNRENQLSLSPNPATSEFKIQNSELRIKKVEMFDVFGKCVYNSAFIIHHSALTIDVSDFTPGIYFVKLISAHDSVTRKIIVQR